MRRTTLIAAAAAVFVAGEAGAASYTSAYFFGDSLTDPGNLYAATGGTTPPPPYWQGRFSNGPVWAEHVADDFAREGLATRNFAFGSANAVTTGDGTDMGNQIDAFAAAGAPLGRRPVAALWFGANDLFDAINAPGTSAATVGSAAVAAATAVGQGIERLAGLGIRDVVVMNLPPLQLTPQFASFTPAAAPLAQFGADTFNQTLAGIVEASASRVTSIDIHDALTRLFADPESFGVSDVVNPCFDRVTVCTPEQALERAFFDPVHPNSVLHRDIADLVRTEVAPVPLPAPVLLLLAGMAGLALVGRRRTA